MRPASPTCRARKSRSACRSIPIARSMHIPPTTIAKMTPVDRPPIFFLMVLRVVSSTLSGLEDGVGVGAGVGVGVGVGCWSPACFFAASSSSFFFVAASSSAFFFAAASSSAFFLAAASSSAFFFAAASSSSFFFLAASSSAFCFLSASSFFF